MIIDYLISSAQQPCFGYKQTCQDDIERADTKSRNRRVMKPVNYRLKRWSTGNQKKFPTPNKKQIPPGKKKQSYANKTVSGWMKFQVRLCSNRRRAQVFVYACYSLRWSGSGRESWVGGCVSCWQKDQSKMVQETGNEEKLEILLMEEILHHLGWLKP